MALAAQRLASHGLDAPRFHTAREVVAHLGAVQAQDYPGALWSVAVRTASLNRADVERAIEARELVRSWPMRGTLHFVPPESLRGMLQVLAQRAIRGAASRHRQLGLDAAIFKKAERVLVKALRERPISTRRELFAVLDAAGIPSANQRGIHLMHYFSTQGLLCFGPRRGKEPTFVLLEEWLPAMKPRPREELLAELALKYFTSHGPSTVAEFARWTGITLADARAAVADAGEPLLNEEREGVTWWLSASTPRAASRPPGLLLPGFDEYLLGYKDRSGVLEARHAGRIVPGSNGMFLPTLVLNGLVAGTWRRRESKLAVKLELEPFRKLTRVEQTQLDAAAERYRRFAAPSA